MRNITRKLITTFATLAALGVVNAFAVYDPNLGRWLNRDPLGEPGGINLYQFVGNNPVGRIDPDGLADFNLDYMPRSSDVLRGSNGYYVEYSHPDPRIIEQYAKAYTSFMFNAASFVPVEGQALRGLSVARNLVTKCKFFQKVPTTALKLPAGKTVANPVPSTMARVIPERVPATTLGRPGAPDVFVTAADDIAGLNASQIADKLAIPPSPGGFKVIEFPTPKTGVASPVFRTDPGFIGGGRTVGGAREFVIPNQRIPLRATVKSVQ